jgi:hypothetical protein
MRRNIVSPMLVVLVVVSTLDSDRVGECVMTASIHKRNFTCCARCLLSRFRSVTKPGI